MIKDKTNSEWSIHNETVYVWSNSGDSFNTQGLLEIYKGEKQTIIKVLNQDGICFEIYTNSKYLTI